MLQVFQCSFDSKSSIMQVIVGESSYLRSRIRGRTVRDGASIPYRFAKPIAVSVASLSRARTIVSLTESRSMSFSKFRFVPSNAADL
jgi:hypothetical protein